METRKEIMEHIKSRTNVEEPVIDVHKFIENYGSGMYAQMCCDRIAEAGLLDSKHVNIDFTKPGHIYVDKIGFLKCEDIFLSYVDQKKIDEVADAMIDQSEHISSMNDLINFLRDCTKKDIRKLLKRIDGNVDIKEDLSVMKEYLKLELKCKGILNRTNIYILNRIRLLFTIFRYRKVIAIIKNCCEKEVKTDNF